MALTEYIIIPGADYQDICDATRTKTGKTDKLKSGVVAKEILSITSGGGGSSEDMTAELIWENTSSLLDATTLTFDKTYEWYIIEYTNHGGHSHILTRSDSSQTDIVAYEYTMSYTDKLYTTMAVYFRTLSLSSSSISIPNTSKYTFGAESVVNLSDFNNKCVIKRIWGIPL